MGAYLRGRWWWYKRSIEGRRYARPLRVRKGQEHMLSARIAQADADIVAEHYGLPVTGAGPDILFSEFIPIYKKRKAGKGSLDRDLQRLDIVLEKMDDKRLAAYRMDDFQDLEKKLAAKPRTGATINRYFQLLHHFFDLAVRERAIAKNPLDGYAYFVEGGSERRALSDDELRTLLRSLRRIRDEERADARDMPVHAVLYDLVRFGLYTGARLSEIVGLTRAEVDGDVIRLKVGRTKFRRRGRRAPFREKKINLPREAREIIAAQPDAGEYVFPLRRRDPRVVSKAIYQLMGRGALGVKDFSFHCLRHTWISRAAEETDGPTVQGMAGHLDYRTTLRYTHADDQKKRDVATRLGTRLGKLDVNE